MTLGTSFVICDCTVNAVSIHEFKRRLGVFIEVKSVKGSIDRHSISAAKSWMLGCSRGSMVLCSSRSCPSSSRLNKYYVCSSAFMQPSSLLVVAEWLKCPYLRLH